MDNDKRCSCGIPELNKSQGIWVLIALGVLFFYNNGDTSMLSAAAPQILAQLGGTELYSLVFSIKMLTNAISVMLCGKLSDKFGRRNIVLVGTALVLIGYVFSGLVVSMPELILARGITGIGSGLSLGVAYTMLGDLFKGKRHATAYMAYMIALGVAMICGPLLGGVLISILPWAWTFWSLVPITLFAFVVIAKIIPNYKVDAEGSKFDSTGAVLFTLACSALLTMLSTVGTYFAWTDPFTITLLVMSVALFAAFFIHEHKTDDSIAIMPVSLMKRRSYLLLCVGQLCLTLNTLCLQTYVPYFMQGVLGTTSTQSGLSISLINICTVTGSMIIIGYIGKTQRYVLFAKLTTICEAVAVILVMLFLKPGIGLGLLYLLMCVYGVSASAEGSIFIMTAQNDLSEDKMAVGTSGLTFVQGTAALIGTAVGGAIINLSNSLAIGIHNVFIFAAIVTVISALLLTAFLQEKYKK